jgi:hypothetical protein
MIAHEAVYINLGSSPSFSHSCHLLAVVLGGNVQREAAHENRIDVSGRAQQVPDSDLEIKISDTNERLNSQLMRVGIILTVDAKVLAGDLKAICDCDVECPEFDLAVEAIE